MYDRWCSAADCTGFVPSPGNNNALKGAVAMEGLISATTGGQWGSFWLYKLGKQALDGSSCRKVLGPSSMNGPLTSRTE